MKLSLLLVIPSLLSSSSVVVVASSNTLRGGVIDEQQQLGNPFACSLAAADEDSCASAKDDDGEDCVWCSFAEAGGVCVSATQSEEISNIVPQVTCGGGGEENTNEREQDSSEFWNCLKQAEEEYCTCTWCTIEQNFGVCLDDSTVEAVEESGIDWLNCDDTMLLVDATIENPIDPNCLAAGMGSDDAQSACDDTLDSSGEPCVWCNVAGISGFGVCLSSEAASAASQYLTCDNDETVSKIPLPDDFAECVSQRDEDECNADSKCTWCNTMAGFGMCFDEESMEIAKMYQPLFNCDDDESDGEEEMIIEEELDDLQSPMDPTCIVVGFQGGDKDECESTDDQDGNPCVWCDGGDASTGICLNADQASIASQWLTCDDLNVDDELFAIESPMDPTCFAAGWQGDDAEESCYDTSDQDGTPCVWCSGPESNMGVCLSSDQASVAGQWLTCEDPNVEIEEEQDEIINASVESPLDPTCVVVAFQGGDKDECESTDDQDGNPCVWCDGGDAMPNGLCLNADQASMASQWLTCDDVKLLEKEEIESPMDPTCLAAGYGEEDAESICHTTNDEDGNACVWCEGMSATLGFCLSADQAAIAGQWLSCEELVSVQTS